MLKRFFLLHALVLGACASTPPNGFGDVSDITADRLGQRIVWRTGGEADKQADAAVAELLKKKLTADDAVRVALLNNRHLQATYEELGVSLSEVVEAGLLKNPTFSATVRFPDRPPSAANLEFDAAMDFLDVLLLPLRKKLAAQQFERAKLLVGDAVLRTAAEVRVAFFTAVAAQQSAAMRHAVLEAAEASHELATRMSEAGNLSELHLSLEQAALEEAKVAAARADGEAAAAREALTRLMGVWGEQAAWTAADSLDGVPAADEPLEHFESLAMEKRLDIAAAKAEAEVVATTLGITRDYRWLTSVQVGASGERDTDRQWVAGPHVSIELPIFNQGQARIGRAEAQLRQAEAKLAALAVDARSEVRAARDRLVLARRLAQQYQRTVIPLRQRIVKLSQQQYNFMITGVFETLTAKQQEYEAYERYIDSVRDYWIARAELERAVGTKIAKPQAAEPAVPGPAAPAMEHKHEHGAKP